MTAQHELEELHGRILRELRENARASYSGIASRLGTTRRIVTQTVQDALDSGELRITTSISPDLLGLERFAYLQLKTDGPMGPVRDALIEMVETTFVADISGAYAIDAEIRVGPDPHLRETVDRVRSLPGVRSLTMHVYESIDINLYSPIRTGSTRFLVDEADHAIVQHLQQDGRASFRTLGEAAGISPSGARLRFERLTAHGAVKVVGIPSRRNKTDFPSLGVGLQARRSLQSALRLVRQLQPEFLAITNGHYDMIATLSAENYEGLIQVTDRLRAADEIESVEAWSNLRILKEQYGEGDQILPTRRRARRGDREGSSTPAPAPNRG
ncbi:Lrp/AsnC family transcriptional regulator [uncultured Agrococcus sp.]|uniref:Lrp/AsnC family transcriptional regulator n=1 Tax=uncultured Agrococcus sp. TaxID=382258 RepID=UPI0025E781E6|nr:Lrp/AsnC family transcriptional regulator [uncultured Agrococcus sp.]